MKLIYRVSLAKLPRLPILCGVGLLIGPENLLLGAGGKLRGQALPDVAIHQGDGGGIVDSCTSGINDIFHIFSPFRPRFRGLFTVFKDFRKHKKREEDYS